MTETAQPSEAPAPEREPTWRDGKRYLWLLGLVLPALPMLSWALAGATGSGVFWWISLPIVFGLVPLADLLVGKDSANPPDRVLHRLEGDRYYRWCTYLYLPLQYAALVLACWLWSRGGLSPADKAGLTVTLGLVAGFGINTAHELGHKKDALERWLARVALAQTCYGHFYIEHNRGHHVRVATPEDPASSRLGQSFWEFLPRAVLGSLRSAWGLEKRRLERRGTSPWTPRNDVLSAWAMSVLLFGVLSAVFGPTVLPMLLAQAVIGFCLLEVVNYLEHYGLLRQRTASGRYERCTPRHSWNSDDIASNVFLYHLQRHSDHHAHPARRYQALRHFDESPQLPTGYAGMVLLALVPPLWRRVMDPRVLSHYGGDVTRANIHPRTRRKVLARHGGGER
ncbi:alkane 1-monooxygenase [Streptomyces sp. ACA25]|uniref:alkane 1-monooxygenase n=1 Tax=Streptomyces sp. ACA25 TaxID=3022596 RepID=UPI002306E007|nr:alkane 1-monooxygenase [Streptomyces sp. ACA25]MDB1090087.1 alkane 1-monooxygenase [Streptomyces sp. ACA25]